MMNTKKHDADLGPRTEDPQVSPVFVAHQGKSGAGESLPLNLQEAGV
jgi:hypothetical protein